MYRLGYRIQDDHLIKLMRWWTLTIHGECLSNAKSILASGINRSLIPATTKLHRASAVIRWRPLGISGAGNNYPIYPLYISSTCLLENVAVGLAAQRGTTRDPVCHALRMGGPTCLCASLALPLSKTGVQRVVVMAGVEFRRRFRTPKLSTRTWYNKPRSKLRSTRQETILRRRRLFTT
jgi:hypothetical protein